MDFKKAYNKQPDSVKLVIIVIAIVLVIYIFKQFKTFWDTPVVNMANIPTVGQNSKGEAVKWNPDPLAAEIFKNFEGWNMAFYPETAKKIVDLQTDDQVILLYNHYNKFYADEYPTLTKLLDNEWDDVYGSYADAVARLKGLGLK